MILSEENVLRELAFTADGYDDISEFLECGDELLYTFLLEQSDQDQYDKITRRLELDIFDVEKFVKINNCPCITDPRAFISLINFLVLLLMKDQVYLDILIYMDGFLTLPIIRLG